MQPMVIRVSGVLSADSISSCLVYIYIYKYIAADLEQISINLMANSLIRTRVPPRNYSSPVAKNVPSIII